MSLLDAPRLEDHTMWDIWSAMYWFPTLTAADELKLVDHLVHQPMTAAEISAKVEIAARPTEGVLGVLTSLGALTLRDGVFRPTLMARTFLFSGSPYYWGGFFRQVRDWPITHEGMLKAIRDNRPAVSDVDVYDMTAEQAEMAARFTRAMHAVTLGPSMTASALDLFRPVKKLLDIGGGSGNFSLVLAQRLTDLQATVMELPAVCPVIEAYAEEFGVADRVTAKPANFFKDSWPTHQDAVFFGNIFHNWTTEDDALLAKKAYEALKPGGRIVLQEMLLADDRVGPLTVAANTMVMLFNFEGKQFTGGELRQLLTSAGFSQVEIIPTYGYYALVTGVKVV